MTPWTKEAEAQVYLIPTLEAMSEPATEPTTWKPWNSLKTKLDAQL